jgi:multiple sugar transport system ATP-binding protein
MARVQLENIRKIYPGPVVAVDGVDLTIADQEFVVLVGPSGCGKSTTLRMVAGLEEITSGVIRIGDRVVNDVQPKDRDVAMVFQNYALYPHMSVFRNMAFGLELRKAPKDQIKKRVEEAAAILEISHLLDRKPKALSGGQKQRVAVGRAIVREPAAFLFDEPLSNLDAKLRITTRAELKRLHQRLRTTTLYVTHDQEEAMTLGDRIVVMKDGQIQQADRPLIVYNQPANRFVAGFIGMPPMNFFDGVLKVISGEMVFDEAKAQAESKAQARITEMNTPAGFRMPVPARVKDKLSGWVGRHIVLGIRPEHFHLAPVGGPGDCSHIDVNVTMVEPLGNDMDVYVQTKLNDQRVVRLEAQAGLERDVQVRLYADLRRAHFFEPGATGMNLSLTQETAHALA